jgi:hypothetical protein
MKVIGPDGARVIALYAAEEIRSGSGWHPADFIREVRERYRFQYVSDLAELKGDPSTLVFKLGTMEKGGRAFAIRECGVYPGGVVIDALVTDDAEAFLDDLFKWGQTRFGWRKPTSLRLRFFSNLVVEFEQELESTLGRLQSICGIFNAALLETYQVSEPYRLKSLVFSCDPMSLPVSAVAPDITIQRRLDFPYSGNRYYCTGPFRTERFKELLQQAQTVLLQDQ